MLIMADDMLTHYMSIFAAVAVVVCLLLFVKQVIPLFITATFWNMRMDGSNELSNRTKNQSIQLSDLSLGLLFLLAPRSSLDIYKSGGGLTFSMTFSKYLRMNPTRMRLGFK